MQSINEVIENKNKQIKRLELETNGIIKANKIIPSLLPTAFISFNNDLQLNYEVNSINEVLNIVQSFNPVKASIHQAACTSLESYDHYLFEDKKEKRSKDPKIIFPYIIKVTKYQGLSFIFWTKDIEGFELPTRITINPKIYPQSAISTQFIVNRDSKGRIQDRYTRLNISNDANQIDDDANCTMNFVKWYAAEGEQNDFTLYFEHNSVRAQNWNEKENQNKMREYVLHNFMS